MQTVASGWTAEERDPVRKIAQNTQISWKKHSTLANRIFTIGVSTIGGNDLIGTFSGAIGSPSNYKYFDESTYVLGLAWERGLNMPVGGLTMGLAEIDLDNTSGRFLPRHMGGNSELYTAILPRRPAVINAGFNYNGIDQVIPQFAGVLSKSPEIDVVQKTVSLQVADYVDYFKNKYLDQSVMFTAQRTDQVMSTLLGTLGMSTAQYDLDYGINTIPFGYFEKGTRFSDIFNQLSEAENGHFYQDETGVFKFRNRQWGDSSPYNTIQRIVLTNQVISALAPDDDHIINVVEIKSDIRSKKPEQTIYRLNTLDSIQIPANSTKEIFVEFQDPVLALTTPTSSSTTSFFVANSASDESGTDLSSSVTITKTYTFAKSAKFTFSNASASIAYLTQLVITGRVATIDRQLYTRVKDDSSVTAYNELPYGIDNPFVQNEDWANSLGQMILNDFSNPENLQKITIRALPELQLYDMVSWQGRYWRIFNIRTKLDSSVGFIQELTLLQRTIVTYFRIGISTIGGSDKIAP